MGIYLIIIFILVVLVYVYDVKNKNCNRNFFYIAIQIVFILLSGLRYRIGIDTPNYIERFYHSYPSLEALDLLDYPIGGDGPLYVLLNSLVISIGGRFYIVQLLQATIVIFLIFHYIKRHTRFVFTCALLYFIYCFIQFNFEIMRGSLSIAISLYGNDYILKKKWIKGYLVYIIALLFHVQAFILFLIPLFLFIRLNIKGIFILLCSFILGTAIQLYFGDFITLLSISDNINQKASFYANNDLYNSAGGNINFYIVYIFPALFYSLFALYYLIKKRPQDKILSLQPFIMIGLVFLLLQMNIQILSRFVDYFKIYFILVISEFFITFTQTKILRKKYSKGVYFLQNFIILLPFFLLTTYQYKLNYQRFIPYNSVIYKNINAEREKLNDDPRISPANLNEY